MDKFLPYINLFDESLSLSLTPRINGKRVFSEEMYYIDSLVRKQTVMGAGKKLGGKDLKLIAQIKNGGLDRERAMSLLFKKFKHFVHRGMSRFKLSESEAQEVYLDSLLALSSAIERGKFMGDSKLSTYLFRIFENKSKNKIRDRMRNHVSHDWIEDIPGLPYKAQNMLQEMIQEEEMDWLEKFLDKMGSRCRQILIMQEFQGYSMEEIAKELGLKSARAVSTSRYRCMEKLKSILGNSKRFNINTK
ncbi:MAG: sigma-70 family RNA polymerase sigma factor [Bacteroidota bacterium]